jgi:penicillin amidase
MKAAEKMSFSNNWYYADWKGNIAYVSVGKIPIRPANQDSRLPADGTGGMEWLGINPFYTNPYVLNPAQGWLTNWNNKPAPETINTDATLYASMDRVQVIMDKLESKDKFTKQEIWDIIRHSAMIDTRYNYFVPFMKEAVKNLPDGAPEKQAVQWISGWDGYRVDLNKDGKYDSPGQTIFDKWIVTMIANTFKDDLGDFFSRTGTPSVFVSAGEKILYHVLLGPQSSIPNNYDFLNGVDRYQAVRDALTQTIAALTAQFGTANMSQWLNADAPHVFSTLNFVNIPQASPTEQIELPVFMNRGTQNHMTVFTKGGVELFNVCPPGQNGFVAPDGTKGPHYDDQLGLYQNFQGKPMEFYYH